MCVTQACAVCVTGRSNKLSPIFEELGSYPFAEGFAMFERVVAGFQQRKLFRSEFTDLPNMLRSLIKRFSVCDCLPTELLSSMISFPK